MGLAGTAGAAGESKSQKPVPRTAAADDKAKKNERGSPPAVPFEFRGARLGMPLAEFRKLPFPDLEDGGSLGKIYAAEARIACTGDIRDATTSYDPLSVDKNDTAAGSIECKWMLPPNKQHYRFSWDEATMLVGELPARTVLYQFSPDVGGEPALRGIVIGHHPSRFADIVSAITTKYGPPTKVEEGEVQNGIGNTFSATTSFWDNGVSNIAVIERAGQIDQMAIVYLHADLTKTYQKAVESSKGAPKI